MVVLQDRRIIVHQGKFRVLKERKEREDKAIFSEFILFFIFWHSLGLRSNVPSTSLLALPLYDSAPDRID